MRDVKEYLESLWRMYKRKLDSAKEANDHYNAIRYESKLSIIEFLCVELLGDIPNWRSEDEF